MKRKKVFTLVLDVILALALAVCVFFLAFPKQAEDVTNWVTGLFQTEEPPIQEEPSLEEPAPEEPEEPSDETPETPDEPTEPVIKTANVYIGDNNVGTVEIDSAVLEDAEALETFWLENYDDNVRSQIDNVGDYSLHVENTSTEDECAIKVSYVRKSYVADNQPYAGVPFSFYENEKILFVEFCVLFYDESNEIDESSDICVIYTENPSGSIIYKGEEYQFNATLEHFPDGEEDGLFIFEWNINFLDEPEEDIVMYIFDINLVYNGQINL